MSRDIAEWGSDIPGRPGDWPRIEPVDVEYGRWLARWHERTAADWARSGQPELARSHEAMAAATLAEVEAIENEDEDAWLAAVAADVRAQRLGPGP